MYAYTINSRFYIHKLRNNFKTQQPGTHYKTILFDSAWLLICCDTLSLIENLYEDRDCCDSLIKFIPYNWKGKSLLESGNSCREFVFEKKLVTLRNKLAAHIDKKTSFKSLLKLFYTFDLKKLHAYCMFHVHIFQSACLSDRRTKMFSFREQLLPRDILGLSYTGHRTVDK